MIKIFIPVSKGRIKTSIRGFWHSKDTKRTYYDYLRIEEHSQFAFDSLFLDRLKKKFNQEALFLTDYEAGYIYTNYDNVKVLSNRISAEVKNLRQDY